VKTRSARLLMTLWLSGLVFGMTGPRAGLAAPEFTVGSKKFTESVVLAEVVRILVDSRQASIRSVHVRELGGTRVLWNALRSGELDAYPEYTGTIRQELLGGRTDLSFEQLRQVLLERGIGMTDPLGFENTYAIGMLEQRAAELEVSSLSDLAARPELPLGFTNEFMDRTDGWPGLKQTYGFRHKDVRGMDHDLAYRGLQSGALAATDLYSTDAEIQTYALRVLEDDRGFFPEYRAVLLYRIALEQSAPGVAELLQELSGQISESQMIAMNAGVKLAGRSETAVAAEFVRESFGLEVNLEEPGVLGQVWAHTLAHLALVSVSLLLAIALALPLGILSARVPSAARVALGMTGVVQTIPSLALLVFMIPLLGIGAPPAIAALFLYSLLPIVRNTYTGLCETPAELRESAAALGLPEWRRLWWIELPLASRSILAGIKTSAVINIGTATLGALIGAGGLGQPILTGIRLDDLGLILQGAVPAALLALLAQTGFDALERVVVPRGLRIERQA